MEDRDPGPGLAVLQDLLKRPGPDVVRWAVEQAQSLARPGTNVQQSQIFQMAGALNAASVAEKQELVRAAISGFGQLPADQRAEALRLVVNTAAAAQVGPHPTAEGEVPPLMQNVMAVVKEAKLHEMPKEEKAILAQEARQDAAEMVQPQQILEVVSELRPEERHQVTEVTASTMRPVYAGSGNGSFVPSAPMPQVVSTGSYAPPVVAHPGAASVNLTDGIPDPESIEQQKRAYERGLDAELEQTRKLAEEQLKQQKAAIKAAAEQQLAMYKAQVDQSIRQQELSLDHQWQQQQMELQQAFLKQKAALEQQASSLAMEYQQRKMHEELLKKQAEMQREMQEMQRRMHMELQDHHQQQTSLQQQHAVQRQQHQEELAAQQARYMQTQAQSISENQKQNSADQRWPGTAGNKSEPVYCRKDVQQHDGRNGSVWVTYRDGVYDVTEYLEKHPGGKLILQAAGGPVDEWWKYWAQHHLSLDVAAALEALRVGRLLDYEEEEDHERYGRGAWEPEQTAPGREESRRTGAILSELPFQTETCVSELSAEFLTPKGKLYVRNHAPVPAIETSTDHMITFVSQQEEELDLTLGQLEGRFPRHRITSILQCTGNRAADNINANGHGTSGFVGGDSEYIGAGMLGNASWSGYRLDDVLGTLFPSLSTLSAEAIQELHLTLEGVDGYYTSIPLNIALEKSADCLLATHMNGEELTPDHGFPVRALLPGIAGARNVKWLAKVAIGKESDGPWTAHYYRTAGRSAPIYALPLNSVILSPEPGAWLHESRSAVAVKGVAYAGGGQHPIQSVELSADRGQSWQAATCRFEEVPDDDCQGPSRSWVRFESVVELPPSRSGARGSGKTSGAPLTELWCRAIDKAGNIQPESSLPQGGYMYNGYHRVPLVRSLKLPMAMPATVVE
ncbi:shop [Symbiodinium sp. CCMP2592]|nr:shop [Symbiodinium sp. CCMP2592]